MSETVLILGATSSIARAIAAEWAKENRDLILAARNREELEKTAADLRIRFQRTVHTVSFDAAQFKSHPSFFEDCLRMANDDLRGVVLCQGYMADQVAAQNDFVLSQQMIDINFSSAVSILNLCSNYFEEKREGFICAISSVAGDRGRQSNYIYGSTKAALNTYLDGLRVRLAKVNVPVITVKPGFVDTRMTWGLPGLFLVASPERVAQDVVRAIQKKKNTVYTPWFWWGIMTIICSIPNFVFKRMKL